jgi:hypothetical protein
MPGVVWNVHHAPHALAYGITNRFAHRLTYSLSNVKPNCVAHDGAYAVAVSVPHDVADSVTHGKSDNVSDAGAHRFTYNLHTDAGANSQTNARPNTQSHCEAHVVADPNLPKLTARFTNRLPVDYYSFGWVPVRPDRRPHLPSPLRNMHVISHSQTDQEPDSTAYTRPDAQPHILSNEFAHNESYIVTFVVANVGTDIVTHH